MAGLFGIDFAKMFGMGKKSADRSGVNAIQLPKSLAEASPTMAPDLNKYIKAQMAGPGYDSELLGRIMGLSTEQMQRTLDQETLPTMSSTYSGRGLGRSTIAGSDLNRQISNTLLAQQQEQARIQAENEAFKQRQREFGIGQGQTYAAQDANLMGQSLQERIRQEEAGVRAEEARIAGNEDINQRILAGLGQAAGPIGTAATAIPFIGPVVGPAISALGSMATGLTGAGGGQGMSGLTDFLSFLNKGPFTSTPKKAPVANVMNRPVFRSQVAPAGYAGY